MMGRTTTARHRYLARKRIQREAARLGYRVFRPTPEEPNVVSLMLMRTSGKAEVRYVQLVHDGQADQRGDYLATGVIPCRVAVPSGVDEFLALLADIEMSAL